MSSENYVGIIMAENLRFPGEGSSAQGKPGAKARPKGVVDAYSGNSGQKSRYWQWPEYDKESFYYQGRAGNNRQWN